MTSAIQYFSRLISHHRPQAAINAKPELTQNGKTAAQNRWIAYNKLRGQYASAMEHAVPEQFWVDKTQCRYTDEQGQIQNPTQADCAQAVSAVRAIAIAQAQGQRIYTINQSNAATALPKLPVGGTVGQEIALAVQAGKEVTVHESQINAHGFTGYGYIITDPETGAGAYLIEGRGNGGWFSLVFNAATALIVIIGIAGFFALSGIIAPIAFLSYYTLALASLALAALYLAGADFDSFNCGGSANCNIPNVIQIIVAITGMAILLSSSSPLGVILGLWVAYVYFRGGYFK